MAGQPPSSQQSISPEFVERYQIELTKDPKSKVFAPLAEAYRKMGMLKEAYAICRRGTEVHPHFAGGLVAFAKVLIDRKEFPEALKLLERAVDLSPDNLLGQSLLGETLLQLRRPKDALRAFKMVLFLNPDDEKARSAVNRWEFLTADEYDEELFQMRPIFENSEGEAASAQAPHGGKLDAELDSLLEETRSGSNRKPTSPAPTADKAAREQRMLERAVSLADAFTIRNDIDAAVQVVNDARRLLGPRPELDNRIRLLEKRLSMNRAENLAPPPDRAPDRKRQILEQLLVRISQRRG